MGAQSTARPSEQRRKQLSKRELRLAKLAERQHGVVSRRQLLDAGLSVRTIGRRIEAGRLHRVHREVLALGQWPIDLRGRWMAAVLACGDRALLSHRSAAAIWGLMRPVGSMVEVTSPSGRGRPDISVHQGGIPDADRTAVGVIPVTTVARTIFDVAEVIDEDRLERVFEEADRLRLLSVPELEAVCGRCPGRRALGSVRRLIEAARMPEDTQSPIEDCVLDLYREYDLPIPITGATVLGREVDALWPDRKLMVEADSWQFHRHRAAFERDRERDAAMQTEGYRVVRLTHRRLEKEPAAVASQLRRLLNLGRTE